MKYFNILLCFSMLSIIQLSCTSPSGCTDIRALNNDYEAKDDDGSCRYSKVTFYSNWSTLGGVPISRIDVAVNQNFAGSVSASYPGGPGNCSAQGTVSFQFTDGDPIDWNAEILLLNGIRVPARGGTVTPSRSKECIRINIAN